MASHITAKKRNLKRLFRTFLRVYILHFYETKEEAAIKYKEFETELNNTRLNLFNQYFTVQDTGFLQVITIK